MIDLAPVGGPLACLGLALLFAGRGRDTRIAALALCVVGGCLLGVALAPTGRPELVGVAGVVAVLLSLAIALALRRWPWTLAFATLALVPARIPVHVAGASSKLLLPLYVLAGAAAVRLALDTLQGDRRSRELGPLALPLAAFALWTGVSLTWSKDVSAGALELLAFFLPFAVLAVGLARLPWSRRALMWLQVELTAMALVFAAIGVWQHQTKSVLWNPKVIYGNAYAPFYRVNSVFWDPSVYGRFLVVAILAALVFVVRARPRRLVWWAAAAIVALWVGLFFSYSQSSFAALVVGVLLVALVAWGRRAAPAVGLVVLIVLAIAVASPRIRHSVLHGSGNAATSGRAGLVTGGLRIAKQNPVLGVGVGGFKRAYADLRHLKGKNPKKAASHDTPITVAAEEGVPGLLLYAWIVLAALATAFRWIGRRFDARTALALGVAFAAIVVHSFAYADFFEDPTTWALLGLIPLAAAVLARRAAETPAEAREPVPEPAVKVPAK